MVLMMFLLVCDCVNLKKLVPSCMYVQYTYYKKLSYKTDGCTFLPCITSLEKHRTILRLVFTVLPIPNKYIL